MSTRIITDYFVGETHLVRRRYRAERHRWDVEAARLASIGYSVAYLMAHPEREIAEVERGAITWHCEACRTSGTHMTTAFVHGSPAAYRRAVREVQSHNLERHPRRARRLYGMQ